MNNEYYYGQNYQQAIQPNNNIELSKIIKVPEAFIETNMFLNIGKTGTFHMSFPDSEIEKDVIFYGKIVEAVRDHIVINNTATGTWYMLPLLYLNYAEFNEKPVIISGE